MTVFSGLQATELAAKADFNPSDTLRQMTFNHAKWLLEHTVEFRVVDRTENDLPAATRRRHDKAKRALLDNFVRTIERGIELGHFRRVDATVAAFSILGMCNWTAWWFIPEGGCRSPKSQNRSPTWRWPGCARVITCCHANLEPKRRCGG